MYRSATISALRVYHSKDGYKRILVWQVLRCEMARKNMYIKDDAAAAAKRGRMEYSPYPSAPSPTPSAGAYYAPAPAVRHLHIPEFCQCLEPCRWHHSLLMLPERRHIPTGLRKYFLPEANKATSCLGGPDTSPAACCGMLIRLAIHMS